MQRDSTFFDHLERRKSGRVRCAQTHSQLGPVADLSRDGCRIISKLPVTVSQSNPITLHLRVVGAEMFAPAHPVACRRRSDGRYDVGFKFMKMSDQLRRELVSLARTAVDRLGHVHRVSA
jgi:hypothetical protein